MALIVERQEVSVREGYSSQPEPPRGGRGLRVLVRPGPLRERVALLNDARTGPSPTLV
jgi:hypothetical protein